MLGFILRLKGMSEYSFLQALQMSYLSSPFIFMVVYESEAQKT